jgi:hypothetical protein
MASVRATWMPLMTDQRHADHELDQRDAFLMAGAPQHWPLLRVDQQFLVGSAQPVATEVVLRTLLWSMV